MCVFVEKLDNIPARFQTRESHNSAVLSVDLKHALRLDLLGERQHVVGVAVGRVNAAYGSSRERVCRHYDEDFQRGDDRFVLTVPDDPQKHPGRRGKSRLTGVTCLREQKKQTL